MSICGSGWTTWSAARATKSNGAGSGATTATRATSKPMCWPTGASSRRYSGGEIVGWQFKALVALGSAAHNLSDHAVKHHDIHFIAGRDIALAVMQHEQAVGLHLRAQHAGALVTDGLDL